MAIAMYDKPTINFLSDGDIIIIQGVNCSITLTAHLKLPTRRKWHVDCLWKIVDGVTSNSTDEQEIAKLLCNLPSNDLTDSVIDNGEINLLRAWVKNKDNQIAMAKAFLDSQERLIDPLRVELEDGIMDQWFYEYKLLQTDYYFNLWQIIKFRFERIIKALETDNFSTPLDLFSAILAEGSDSLIRPLMSKYYEYSPHKIDRFNQLRKKEKLTTEEKKQFHQLDKIVNSNLSLLRIVICAIEQIIHDDIWLQTKTKILNNLVDGIIRLEQKAHRDPSLSYHGFYKTVKYSHGKRLNKVKKLCNKS